MNELLNIEERNELERCEVVIKQGLQTFVEVGQALMLIRDKRLYRAEYGTFEDYCNDKWQLGRNFVNKTIAASKVVANLGLGTIVPKTETQARPLTKIEPELQSEVWQETVNRHGDNITQKKVEEVVNDFKPLNDELKQAKKEPMFAAQTEAEILAKAKEIREKKKQERQSSYNIEKEVIPLPADKYDVIYCDPPWRYDFSKTQSRDIENHYPTMTLEDIKALDVPAAENSVLLMWATAPKIKEALDVIEAWGFEYKTQSIWDKGKLGMGYWFRGQHEILLIATKGKYSPPIPENRFSSVYKEDRTAHSKKPLFYYDMIKTMFPDSKRIELFSRKAIEGFDNWGNEKL